MTAPDQPTDPPTKNVSAGYDKPLAPQDDIGPFYKWYAAFFGGGLIILLVVHAVKGTTNTYMVLGELAGIGMLVLGLVRPDKFDNVVKNIADWLPSKIMKYTKD